MGRFATKTSSSSILYECHSYPYVSGKFLVTSLM